MLSVRRIPARFLSRIFSRPPTGSLPNLFAAEFFPRFAAAADGIHDHLTGLVWFPRVLPEQGEVSWQEALDTAALMDGWRVPTIWELESLVDVSRAWPALPPGLSWMQGVDGLWSSTTSGYDPAWAWVLYCGKGAVGVGHKPGKHFKTLLTRIISPGESD